MLAAAEAAHRLRRRWYGIHSGCPERGRLGLRSKRSGMNTLDATSMAVNVKAVGAGGRGGSEGFSSVNADEPGGDGGAASPAATDEGASSNDINVEGVG